MDDRQEISRLVQETRTAFRDANKANLEAAANITGMSESMKKFIALQSSSSSKNSAKDAYEAYLKTLIKGDTELHRQRRELLLQEFETQQTFDKQKLKEQQQLSQSNDTLNQLLSEQSTVINDCTRSSSRLTTAQAKHASEVLMGAASAATIRELQEAAAEDQANRLKKTGIDTALQKSAVAVNKLTKSIGVLDDLITKTDDERERNEAILSNKHGIAQDQATAALEKHTAQIVKSALAMTTFGQGFKLIYEGNKALLSSGMDVTVGQEHTANTLGWTAAQAGEEGKKNRQVMLANGGTAAWLSNMEKSSAMFTNTIGDVDDRTKFVSASLNTMAKSGITPSSDNLAQLAKTYSKINKVTNLSSEEFAAYMDETMTSEEVLGQLRAVANEKERKQIRDNIATRFLEQSAIGKSAELISRQNKEAHAAMGGKAVDRIGQSYRLQQLAKSMNMSDQDSKRLQQLKMLGADRAPQGSAAQVEWKALLGQLQQNVQKSRTKFTADGNADLAAEIFTDTLIENLGFDIGTVNDTPFAKATAGAAENLGNVGVIAKTLGESFQWLSNSILKNPWMQFAGAIASIAASAAIIKGIVALGKMLIGGSAAAASGGIFAGLGAAISAAAVPVLIATVVGGTLGMITKTVLDHMGNTPDGLITEKDGSRVTQQQHEANRKKTPGVRGSGGGGGGGTASEKEQEAVDPSIKFRKTQNDYLQRIRDNSETLPKILEVAEQTLAVNIASLDKTQKSKFAELLNTKAGIKNWNKLLTE